MPRHHLVPFRTKKIEPKPGGGVPLNNSRADCAPKLARPLVGSQLSHPRKAPRKGGLSQYPQGGWKSRREGARPGPSPGREADRVRSSDWQSPTFEWGFSLHLGTRVFWFAS
jgi:hypothetical protein